MATKKKAIGIIFGYGLGNKSKSIRKDSGFGGGPDLGRFGGKKPRESGISGAMLNIEVAYAASRKEFFQFCSDLWIAIVRNSVWHQFATGPSPLNMIYTRINKDGVDFGWRNYPSESKARAKRDSDKGRPYKGPEQAQARFDARASIFEEIVKGTGTRWFTEGAKGDKTTRSTIASERIRYAISEAASMQAPSGEKMPFSVPIRSGQRKDEFGEKLHGNADRAVQRQKSKIKNRLPPGRARERFPEDYD